MKRFRIWWCENVIGHLWDVVNAAHLPSVWRVEECVRCHTRQIYRISSAYRNEDIVAMIDRLSRAKEITATQAAWVARRVHQCTPWAGRPVAWEDMSADFRREATTTAHMMLLKAKIDREGNQ